MSSEDGIKNSSRSSRELSSTATIKTQIYNFLWNFTPAALLHDYKHTWTRILRWPFLVTATTHLTSWSRNRHSFSGFALCATAGPIGTFLSASTANWRLVDPVPTKLERRRQLLFYLLVKGIWSVSYLIYIEEALGEMKWIRRLWINL